MCIKILIVEDEVITALDIKKSLEKLGFKVLSIEDTGKNAIAAIGDLKPDLVLMDIVLKGEMDGIETTEVINSRFDVPIIYLTAYSDEKTFERAKLTEPYGFIVKPAGIYELKCNIENAFYKYKMEKKLEKQADLLNLTHDAIIVHNMDDRIIFWNHGAEDRYGWHKEDVLGKVTHDLFKTEFPDSLRETCEKFLCNGYWEGELTHTKRSGEKIIVSSRWALQKDENDNPIGFMEINTDITERKRAEESLREARDKLELKVRERTAKLNILVEELKRSNGELKQFAYVTSHDLQEPLRTISSFTQLLKRRYENKLDKDADEFIDYIVDGANRMQIMIRALLDYSRVNTRNSEFKSSNFEGILDQTMNSLKTAIDESHAIITRDSLPMLMVDDKQMIQLFQNLISNAIKFRSEDKNLKIHVSCQNQGNNNYIFSVSDNGIGIESQFKDRIFEVFQRLHTRDEYSGTGIGLAICKKIVERHGGQIWIESELGAGSTFYFTLPTNLAKP
jgi:PAS domain S-box-containing protein